MSNGQKTHKSDGIAFAVTFKRRQPVGLKEFWVRKDGIWHAAQLEAAKYIRQATKNHLIALFAALELARRQATPEGALTKAHDVTLWRHAIAFLRSRSSHVANLPCFLPNSAFGEMGADLLIAEGTLHPFFRRWFSESSEDKNPQIVPAATLLMSLRSQILFYKVSPDVDERTLDDVVGSVEITDVPQIKSTAAVTKLYATLRGPSRDASGAAIAGAPRRPRGEPKWVSSYIQGIREQVSLTPPQYYVDPPVAPCTKFERLTAEGRDRIAPSVLPRDPQKIRQEVHPLQLTSPETALLAAGRSVKCTVLLGTPGAGKTSVLSQYLHTLLDRRDEGQEVATVPIFVDLSSKTLPVSQIIAEALAPYTGDIPIDFEGARMRITLLFDGLDRLEPGTPWADAVEQIVSYSRRPSVDRVLLSCKTSYWQPEYLRNVPEGEVQILRLLPFTPGARGTIAEYVHIRFPSDPYSPLRMICENPRVQKMAENPQYLCMICEYTERNSVEGIPLRQSALLRECLHQRLVDVGLPKGKLRIAYQTLESIARAMVSMGTLEAAEEDLERTGAQIPRVDDKGLDVVDMLCQARILASSGYPGNPPLFRFAHQTFQEFFAAQAVANAGQDSVLSWIQSSLQDMRLDGVMSFLVSGLKDERLAEEALCRIWDVDPPFACALYAEVDCDLPGFEQRVIGLWKTAKDPPLDIPYPCVLLETFTMLSGMRTQESRAEIKRELESLSPWPEIWRGENSFPLRSMPDAPITAWTALPVSATDTQSVRTVLDDLVRSPVADIAERAQWERSFRNPQDYAEMVLRDMKSEDMADRFRACWISSTIDDQAVRNAFIDLLHDPNADVHSKVTALKGINAALALDLESMVLRILLDDDADDEIRHVASRAIQQHATQPETFRAFLPFSYEMWCWGRPVPDRSLVVARAAYSPTELVSVMADPSQFLGLPKNKSQYSDIRAIAGALLGGIQLDSEVLGVVAGCLDDPWEVLQAATINILMSQHDDQWRDLADEFVKAHYEDGFLLTEVWRTRPDYVMELVTEHILSDDCPFEFCMPLANAIRAGWPCPDPVLRKLLVHVERWDDVARVLVEVVFRQMLDPRVINALLGSYETQDSGENKQAIIETLCHIGDVSCRGIWESIVADEALRKDRMCMRAAVIGMGRVGTLNAYSQLISWLDHLQSDANVPDWWDGIYHLLMTAQDNVLPTTVIADLLIRIQEGTVPGPARIASVIHTVERESDARSFLPWEIKGETDTGLCDWLRLWSLHCKRPY